MKRLAININCPLIFRVLARIIFTKKHVATTMTHHLGEIFLVKCQKQAFSFNKREAKVYCYGFLHVLILKRDTCIHVKHEKTIKKNKKTILFFYFYFLVSCVPAGGACVPAGGACVPAQHAKIPWLEP
jgi:hypothetical protein